MLIQLIFIAIFPLDRYIVSFIWEFDCKHLVPNTYERAIFNSANLWPTLILNDTNEWIYGNCILLLNSMGFKNSVKFFFFLLLESQMLSFDANDITSATILLFHAIAHFFSALCMTVFESFCIYIIHVCATWFRLIWSMCVWSVRAACS